MHPEPWQQRLLRGDLGTQERHNTQRLEDGWMTWIATKWAGGRDPDIRWDFSSAEAPVLNDTLFSSVVDHIPACPRCTHLLALMTDGKAGAGRRVCSNLNKFRLIPELQAMIHTGCERHADSYHLYCSSCDVDLSATALGGVATSRQARVLEARVAPDLQPPELLYKVEFADGVARKLCRREVALTLPAHEQLLRIVDDTDQIAKPFKLPLGKSLKDTCFLITLRLVLQNNRIMYSFRCCTCAACAPYKPTVPQLQAQRLPE